ncbi:toll/interleukin-1 receptor domain-containing protein [Nostoc sp. CCY0012]|uniref:toll/interleukin-1 receptor domain-containing protein n=1 Tax=Nostoc sp. CCY0012 TaxID=1056123 RepID=UPI0039C6FF16
MKQESVLFSEVYNIETSEQDDWFNPRLDRDTHLCIDPFQVFKSKDPFFSNCRQKFMQFFRCAFDVASKICEVPSQEDKKSGNLPSKYKKLIYDTLRFPEVEEVCLGFSKRTTGGAGMGKDFAIKLSDALINLSKKSSSPPKHFEQIEIFTPGIGKDKISDATGNLIKKELVLYTRDVCKRLAISDEHLKWNTVKNFDFDFEYNEWDDQSFYLPLNPFNNKPILLVPKAFLREIPSIGSEQLYRFIKSRENEQLRAKLNSDLHDDLKKYDLENEEEEKEDDSSNSAKKYVLGYIEQHPEILNEFINDVETHPDSYTQYNFEKDTKNIIKLPRVIKEFVDKNPLPRSTYSNSEEFREFLISLILKLKQFVEDEEFNGYKHLWEIHEVDSDTDNLAQHNLRFRSQSIVKNLVEELIGEYCYQSKVKLKSESGLGKNPVEFKCSDSNYKEKALFLAKTIGNVNFDEDALKKLTSDLRRGKVKFCYYLVFVHSSEALEKLKEAIQEIEKFDFQDLFFKLVLINSAQERDLDILSLECRYMTTQKEVCISYARGGNSGEIVDKLCKILKNKNIDIVRDSEELKYKDPLKNFMQRLGKGKCVITVISDKYLKSRYCMFELTELIENGKFQERIVPLVLEDAKIYEPVDIVEYIRFWEEKLEATDKAMKSVQLANLAPNIREDIELYSKITRTISEFIGHLRDFLVLPIDIHENSNFEDVVNEINKILSR